MNKPETTNLYNFTEHARRITDRESRDIEHKARNIAQSEGPLSPVWQELSKIDRHRRDGRVISITELGRINGERDHYIKWVEQPSDHADLHGYLFPKPTGINDDAINRLAWAAFSTGMVVGIALGISLAQSGVLLP